MTDSFSRRPIAHCVDRIGVARLTRMYESGIDLHPLWQQLIAKLIDGSIEAGEGLDLSIIAQLLGDKEAGLAIQNEILKFQRLFRSPCAATHPRLRVLALAAPTDMGSNTPIEFLLEKSGIELLTLYITPEAGLPDFLPDHDVAIVVASDSADCRDALDKIKAISLWPRPLLNLPHRVSHLDRDKLYRLLSGIEGLVIPPTLAVARGKLSALARQDIIPCHIHPDLAFPLIARPCGSHAGRGLARIDDAITMMRYLGERHEQEFFLSGFVDYSGHDGLFRKYRLVFIDGVPHACHLAVADRWDIWYVNAGMAENAAKRLEEETFMRTFDEGFAHRHRAALIGLVNRIGLDYFTLDCAETRDGSLLIFEADNTAIVHDMDSPEVFPYKATQMQKVFDAFAAMLLRRAGHVEAKAA